MGAFYLEENEMNLPPVADFRQSSADYTLVERAILYINGNARHQPELREVAAAVGLSEFHFQRLFTRWAGISPKRFLQFVTREHAKDMLDRSENLLDTTLGVGLSSMGRLHDLFITTEAVTPGEYKSRGAGMTIRYGLHATPFGRCLIGVTIRGVCHLGFVQTSEGDTVDELVSFWQQAVMIEDSAVTASIVARIFDMGARLGRPLPVLLRGTNFQIKVWEGLMRIPAGSITTYEELACHIGAPSAVRAVANAVAHNPVPILIPCHRVIRKLGEFGKYRYGAARKQALLGWESSQLDLHTASALEA